MNMQIRKCDKEKCGIYCITNTYNDKVYIGKAKDIYNWMMHIDIICVKSIRMKIDI